MKSNRERKSTTDVRFMSDDEKLEIKKIFIAKHFKDLNIKCQLDKETNIFIV